MSSTRKGAERADVATTVASQARASVRHAHRREWQRTHEDRASTTMDVCCDTRAKSLGGYRRSGNENSPTCAWKGTLLNDSAASELRSHDRTRGRLRKLGDVRRPSSSADR